ncbi:unnamed protein product [Ixodes persulcatus]
MVHQSNQLPHSCFPSLLAIFLLVTSTGRRQTSCS